VTRGRLHVALVSLAAVALVAAGCGGDNDKKESQEGVPAQPSNAGAPPSADTGARLAVDAPGTGSAVSENAVSAAVSIDNFRVDCRFAGTPNRQGVGHYHIELDHKLVNMYCGSRA
jgi:hypothetical protein